MRRALIRKGNRPALGLTFGLALHQQSDAAAQPGDLALLARHDLGQVLDRPGQMRDRLFQPLVLVHMLTIR